MAVLQCYQLEKSKIYASMNCFVFSYKIHIINCKKHLYTCNIILYLYQNFKMNLLIILVMLVLKETLEQCPIGQYQNQGCTPCAVICYQCDANGCTSCLIQNFRILFNTQCIPIDGYYETDRPVAGKCPQSQCKSCDGNQIYECLVCFDGYYLDRNSQAGSTDDCFACNTLCKTCNGPDSNNCLSCLTGYYLASGVCQLCSLATPGCSACSSQSQCNSCQDSYFFQATPVIAVSQAAAVAMAQAQQSINFATRLLVVSQPLQSGSCTLCPLQCRLCTSVTSCQSCSQYYTLVGESCVDKCGDGYVITNACDLPQGIEKDGCTDDCQIQTNFTCITQNYASYCSYSSQISLSFINFSQKLFENIIVAKYKLEPNLKAFSQVDLSEYFSLNSPSLKILSYSYSQASGQIDFEIAYDQSIQNMTVQIVFNGSKVSSGNNRMFFATPVSSSYFTLSSVQYYSDSQFEYSKFVYATSFILLAFGWIGCLAALPVRRLAGLEIMFLLQFSWIVLMWFPNFMPFPVEMIIILKYTSGYNDIFDVVYQNIYPRYVNLFQVGNTYLWQDFNLNFLFYVTPLLIAAICKIVQKVSKDQETKLRSRNAYERMLQLFMYGCMFNVLYFTTCSVIYFIQGDLTDIGSIIVFVLPIIITFGLLVKFWFDPDPFGRFRYEFRIHKLAYAHYYLYFSYLVGTILLTGLVSQYSWMPLVIIVPFSVYTAIFRPYKEKRQNIRSTLYLLLMGYATGINTYAQYYPASALMSNNFFTLHGCFIVCLIVALIWCYIQIIYTFYQKYSRKQNIEKNFSIFQEFKALQTSNQQGKNSLAASLLSKNINIFELIKLQQNKLKQLNTTKQQNQNSNRVSSPLNDYILNQSNCSKDPKSNHNNKSMQIQIQMAQISKKEVYDPTKNNISDQFSRLNSRNVSKLILEQQNYFKLKEALKFKQKCGLSSDRKYLDQYDAI